MSCGTPCVAWPCKQTCVFDGTPCARITTLPIIFLGTNVPWYASRTHNHFWYNYLRNQHVWWGRISFVMYSVTPIHVWHPSIYSIHVMRICIPRLGLVRANGCGAITVLMPRYRTVRLKIPSTGHGRVVVYYILPPRWRWNKGLIPPYSITTY